MSPIPPKIREELTNDPFMKTCIINNPDCRKRVEWEHAFIYAGKQINERWAIVPVCTYHHRGAGLNKAYNEYIALTRATELELAKYPRRHWGQLRSHLKQKFGTV